MAIANQEVEVQSVEFPQLGEQPSSSPLLTLGMLRDLVLQVRVELGQGRLPLSEVLALGPGSVIELDKQAGEMAEIYVNDRLLARGEVVVVDENFGVRIAEIVKPQS